MTIQTSSPHGEVYKDILVLCTHIFEGGHCCASPTLLGQTHCYYHHPARQRTPSARELHRQLRLDRRTFSVPTPSTRPEFLQTLSTLLQAIADDRVAPNRAARLLFALQQLALTLPAIAPESRQNSEAKKHMEPLRSLPSPAHPGAN
ncbi:MAG: hypothetical protein JWM43_3638 [Acidobacteriaceae bacterium]|nr:hypothetical protein [Acidobacteriaceae bacterium]